MPSLNMIFSEKSVFQLKHTNSLGFLQLQTARSENLVTLSKNTQVESPQDPIECQSSAANDLDGSSQTINLHTTI